MMSTSNTDAAPVWQAALWMSGAIVAFTSMAIAGRAVSFELDTFEIMTYRSAVGLVVVLLVARALGHHRTITKRHMGVHAIRNVGHFFGQNMWFYAITVAPLAQVFALEFTSPIWVVLLAPLVLGEPLTRDRIAIATLGFVGVLIVARPWAETIGPGVITGALAAIGFAISALFTRRLTRTETITCILFWLTAMQLIFGLICAGIDGDLARPSPQSLPWLGIIALAGLLAHLCLTKALSLAPASVVMPFDFLRLPVIIGVGILLYGEPFDVYVLIGGCLIFAVSYLNVWTVRKETQPKT